MIGRYGPIHRQYYSSIVDCRLHDSTVSLTVSFSRPSCSPPITWFVPHKPQVPIGEIEQRKGAIFRKEATIRSRTDAWPNDWYVLNGNLTGE